PGGVGGKAEIGGVAEGDDSGIAEDEIERERKQRSDRDVTREHEIIGREYEGEQGREPERDLERTPADLRLEITLRLARRSGRHCPRSSPDRPHAEERAKCASRSMGPPLAASILRNPNYRLPNSPLGRHIKSATMTK